MLRLWQSECAAHAIQKYRSGGHHYFCQATPGAGKTTLAAEIAFRLLKANMIDLVLCFAPSLTVVESIKTTFSSKLKRTFNGRLGCIGQSLTYQSLQFLDDEFWAALRRLRVFVVFDEIHHCSGSCLTNANTWGLQVLSKIQHLATYTLAMSGTPWRTDSLPIVMAQYTDPEGALQVDYQYTLKQAVNDQVCRSPKIVLIDNHNLSITSKKQGYQSFTSIDEFLRETKTSYQSIIHNRKAMKHLLILGCEKLAEIRKSSVGAGGLVVAASVRHAQSIAKMLIEELQQSVAIVTYLDEMPLAEIQRFREGNTQWIISVGMVSEGTDIPRLQVCCHLSSIKTELYFRQVLGRILRVNQAPNQEAWLYTFAESNLVTYAESIEQDIPETCLYCNIDKPLEPSELVPSPIKTPIFFQKQEQNRVSELKFGGISDKEKSFGSFETGFDELTLGEFQRRVILAFL